MTSLAINRLNSLKNLINECLTPNNELDVEYFESMSSENIKEIQDRIKHLINRWEERHSFSGNADVDMTMYLDQLYKIRNDLDLFMRNREISDANIAHGGIRYKRRSKMRSNRRNKRTKRRNKRTKRRNKQ
jgi:hypothetical protein